MKTLFTIIISAFIILPGAIALVLKTSLLLCDICTKRGEMQLDWSCFEVDFSMPCYTYCHDEDVVLGRERCCVRVSHACSYDNILTNTDHLSVLASVVFWIEKYIAIPRFHVRAAIPINVFLLAHVCL